MASSKPDSKSPAEAKPSQAKPSQAKPSQAKLPVPGDPYHRNNDRTSCQIVARTAVLTAISPML
jgi:hypothetical protein